MQRLAIAFCLLTGCTQPSLETRANKRRDALCEHWIQHWNRTKGCVLEDGRSRIDSFGERRWLTHCLADTHIQAVQLIPEHAVHLCDKAEATPSVDINDAIADMQTFGLTAHRTPLGKLDKSAKHCPIPSSGACIKHFDMPLICDARWDRRLQALAGAKAAVFGRFARRKVSARRMYRKGNRATEEVPSTCEVKQVDEAQIFDDYDRTMPSRYPPDFPNLTVEHQLDRAWAGDPRYFSDLFDTQDETWTLKTEAIALGKTGNTSFLSKSDNTQLGGFIHKGYNTNTDQQVCAGTRLRSVIFTCLGFSMQIDTSSRPLTVPHSARR